MDNSLKISSSNFDHKTKIELAICQLYNIYFKKNNEVNTYARRIRTDHLIHNSLFFNKIESTNRKLKQEKFENKILYRYINEIRTFFTKIQSIIFQTVIRKIQFKSCTKWFNDNPCKFTEKVSKTYKSLQIARLQAFLHLGGTPKFAPILKKLVSNSVSKPKGFYSTHQIAFKHLIFSMFNH